jgi:hypothetical protein
LIKLVTPGHSQSHSIRGKKKSLSDHSNRVTKISKEFLLTNSIELEGKKNNLFFLLNKYIPSVFSSQIKRN